ncbi:Methyltransferase-like protein 23 [Gamsiella multidivaricata]|nr:Methyltransferase-like protein 23 [Gamsiella multidivaricata]
MQAHKRFHYESPQGDIDVEVLEPSSTADSSQLLDPVFGLYVWPSALVLAEYVAFHLSMFLGTPGSPKVILELGAGTALPSLLLAKAASKAIDGETFVIITDRPDVPQIQNNVCEALKENGISTLYPEDPEARVQVRGLGWGDFTLANEQNRDGGLLQLLRDVVCIDQIRTPRHIDLIIGSDVLYNPSDFEPLLATVSYIINRHNPDCVFMTTYQNRSAKRNIDHLLQKWGLEGRVIDWEDFNFDITKFITVDEEKSDSDNEGRLQHEEQDKSFIDTPGKDEDDRWLRRAREEVERAMGTSLGSERPLSGPKAALVDYSSGSSSEGDTSTVDDEPEDNDRQEHIKGKSHYRMGDGGALSSVYLLWICKRGRDDLFDAWKMGPKEGRWTSR